jgi:hypothetical protein
LRSSWPSSRLVRQLGDGIPVDAQAPGMDFAERLSLWLNAFDAIGLQAAQQAIRSIATAADGKPAARPPRAEDIAEDVQRVRSILARAIAQDFLPLATPDPDGTADRGYAPFHQRHQELQRQMEQMVGALRDHVRQALGRVSPRLRQLAALDASMEQLLAQREQALLASAPVLLRRRFAQLPDAGAAAQTFLGDWREALLAELDLRLEPVVGLLAALRNETRHRQ